MKRWFSIFTRCSKRNTCIKLLNFEDLFSNMTYFQIIFYSNSKESYFAKNGFTIYFLRFLEPTIFNLSVIYMSPTKQSTQLVCQL